MNPVLRSSLQRVLQLLLFVAFAFVVGYLSSRPVYQYAPADMAVVKLSLSHAAERLEPCVQLTVEEIAAMPANQRRPAKCTRERLPLIVELDIDGELVFKVDAPPSGLWNDGPASIYERINVAPGAHRVTARLRDTGRESGWDYTHTADVELAEAGYFTVTFQAETGGFEFR